MDFVRMPIEIESPEQMGYGKLRCNLTESSVSDLHLKDLNLDLNPLKLEYAHHVGLPELRDLVAACYPGICAEDVLITAGASSAIFFLYMALLKEGDGLLVVHPNYGINYETPRAMKCNITYFNLSFEEGFVLDVEKMKKMVQPGTKMISITQPHNPTGTMITEEQLQHLAAFCLEKDIWLLVDETYRDLGALKTTLGASINPKVISISSLSKAFGAPGIRMGWIINRSNHLMHKCLAVKEQVNICNSVVDEYIALRILQEKEGLLSKINRHVQTNREDLFTWLNAEKRLEWVKPQGGVVIFPAIKAADQYRIDDFYRVLNNEYGTFVGPGHWFEQERRFFRLGYGWPSLAELREGLKSISMALDASKK